MSLKITRQLICDSCKAESPAADGKDEHRFVRVYEVAKQAGWKKNKKDEDLCPTCAQIHPAILELIADVEVVDPANEVEPFNQPEYRFYAVINGKIESGWEYWEDAADQLEELRGTISGEVPWALSTARCLSLGIDPNDNNNWANAVQ